jgi:hypothetical protein
LFGTIWEAVSDGALSAPVEAPQFLEDFAHIIGLFRGLEVEGKINTRCPYFGLLLSPSTVEGGMHHLHQEA